MVEVEKAQSIASVSKHSDNIPSEFIRSEKDQPAATASHGVHSEVPVIDLSHEEKVIRLTSEASREWGIFQVVNHGIPDEVIAKLQRVGRDFFELPIEEKELIAKTPDSGLQGYGTNLNKEIEGQRGWVDHHFHRIWPPSSINYNFWPKNPPSYREANEEYMKKLLEVSNKMIQWLSLGLGLGEQELKAAMGGQDTIFLMKINYYPPCPRPDLALGVVAHTDMSALTILVPNEVPGLQVFRGDHWYDVKYIPNALIIHIGDQLEILSNGKYKAVYHRTTVNRESTRMSWPVFLEPPPEFEIGPISKLVNEGNPSRYKTKKYKDYAYCKLNKLPQ